MQTKAKARSANQNGKYIKIANRQKKMRTYGQHNVNLSSGFSNKSDTNQDCKHRRCLEISDLKSSRNKPFCEKSDDPSS